MTALLDILEPRAIELAIILILGGIVAGLVTYIIRNLQGSIDMLSPTVQAQESRVSNLEGRMEREHREWSVILRAIDLKFEAVNDRYDAFKLNVGALHSDMDRMRTEHDQLSDGVRSDFRQVQANFQQVKANFQDTQANFQQVKANLQDTQSNIQQMQAMFDRKHANIDDGFDRLTNRVEGWYNSISQLNAETQRDIGEIHTIIQNARERVLADE